MKSCPPASRQQVVPTTTQYSNKEDKGLESTGEKYPFDHCKLDLPLLMIVDSCDNYIVKNDDNEGGEVAVPLKLERVPPDSDSHRSAPLTTEHRNDNETETLSTAIFAPISTGKGKQPCCTTICRTRCAVTANQNDLRPSQEEATPTTHPIQKVNYKKRSPTTILDRNESSVNKKSQISEASCDIIKPSSVSHDIGDKKKGRHRPDENQGNPQQQEAKEDLAVEEYTSIVPFPTHGGLKILLKPINGIATVVTYLRHPDGTPGPAEIVGAVRNFGDGIVGVNGVRVAGMPIQQIRTIIQESEPLGVVALRFRSCTRNTSLHTTHHRCEPLPETKTAELPGGPNLAIKFYGYPSNNDLEEEQTATSVPETAHLHYDSHFRNDEDLVPEDAMLLPPTSAQEGNNIDKNGCRCSNFSDGNIFMPSSNKDLS